MAKAKQGQTSGDRDERCTRALEKLADAVADLAGVALRNEQHHRKLDGDVTAWGRVGRRVHMRQKQQGAK